MIETSSQIDLTLPAQWACNLIDGDRFNYSEAELNKIDDFMAKQELGECVCFSEQPFFTWSNDSDLLLGGDCLVFTFLKVDENKATGSSDAVYGQ